MLGARGLARSENCRFVCLVWVGSALICWSARRCNVRELASREDLIWVEHELRVFPLSLPIVEFKVLG